MIRLKHTVWLMMALSFISVVAQENEAWTLERCVEHAMAHNLDLKIRQNVEQKAVLDHRQSRWSMAPSVNGWSNSNMNFQRATNQFNQIESGTTHNTTYGISSSLDLFAGFTKQNTMAAKRFYRLATHESTRLEAINLELEVTETYIQLLYQKDLVTIAEEQLQIIDLEVQRIEAMIASGRMEAVARAEINALHSSAKLELNRAQNSYRLLQLKLSQLIELPSGTMIEPVNAALQWGEPHLSNLNVDKAFSLATNYYPSLLQKEHELEFYRRQLMVARGQMSPSVTLNGSYTSGFFSTDTLPDGKKTPFKTQFDNYRNPAVGLTINIPIFNGKRNNYQIKMSHIDVKTAVYSLESMQKMVRRELEESLLMLESRYLEFENASDNLNFATQSFNSYQERFRLGMINTTEFMNAQNLLMQAKASQLMAKYSWTLQKRIVQLYTGNPKMIDKITSEVYQE